ncbi:MAG: SpoIIE family protein phosphatase [Bacteroidota bacterium]
MKHHHIPSTSDSHIVPLLEFSKVVNSSLDLSFILGTLLLTLMGKLLVPRGVVLLKIKPKTYVVKYGKGIPREILETTVTLPRDSAKGFSVTTSNSKGCDVLVQKGINRFFPIIAHDAVIGYVGLAEHPQRPIVKENVQFIDTILNISAAAIEKSLAFDELRSVNRTLDGKIQQLKTLFELGKEFSSILDRERLLKLFSLTVMGQVGTNRFAICLKEGGSVYSRINSEFLEKDRNVLCSLVTTPLFVSDIPKKKKYDELRAHAIKEKIAAFIPLQIQNEVKGVLCLGERLRGGEYTPNDLEYVFSLANLAFVSLENSRLFNETIEKQKLENELLIAREIQQGLLPRVLPKIQGFEIAAVNISSKQVGGDYYDVIPASDGTFIITIADVSGKGTPASLLMANVQATVHALVPFNLALPVATARINDVIHRNTSSDKFITFFWGSLDPASKNFRYVNAGHNPPFVVRANGAIERLTEGGMILGIMKTMMPYQEGKVELNSGDTVILFTDGVSEAMDAYGNDYTEERLERFVQTFNGLSAEKILTAIKNEIQLYTAGAPQSDDITLVVFKAK